MSANVGTVMTGIATGLSTITGLRVFAFPPLAAQPPFAFVNLPESIDYDLTMGRGSDSFSLEIWVGVAAVVDRTSTAALQAYASGAGPQSIKAAVEAAVGSTCRVSKATFAPISLAGNTYAGIAFTVDVAS